MIELLVLYLYSGLGASYQGGMQTCGDPACHPERSEGSGSTGREILRCAQDDSQDTSPVRFREAFSLNIWTECP